MAQTCVNNNVSLVNTICDYSYMKSHKSLFTQYMSNGLTDSFQYFVGLHDFNKEYQFTTVIVTILNVHCVLH